MCETISRAGSFRAGFFFVRNILSGGAFSLCETSFRAGFFLVCAGLSLVRGFPLCGVPSVRGSFRAGFFSVRGFFLCGAFSCAGLLPCGVLFRHPDWCDCRAGFRMLRAAPSFPRPLSRALFPAPSFPSPLSCPRYLSACPAGRAPRRAFPCLSACRWALPGAFSRVLRACGCPRRTVVPRSVFDSLLKSPGPVLGIPPNFSYLWMQKMSFAALKTYRTE